jgi:hypothetical protein
MDNFTVLYIPEDGIIRLHLQGEIDAQMLSMATSKLVEEISRCNCDRLLMDHREAKLNLSVSELFNRPLIATELGVPHSSRIAIIYSTREPEYRFVETVGRNRGFDVEYLQILMKGLNGLKDDRRVGYGVGLG